MTCLIRDMNVLENGYAVSSTPINKVNVLPTPLVLPVSPAINILKGGVLTTTPYAPATSSDTFTPRYIARHNMYYFYMKYVASPYISMSRDLITWVDILPEDRGYMTFEQPISTINGLIFQAVTPEYTYFYLRLEADGSLTDLSATYPTNLGNLSYTNYKGANLFYSSDDWNDGEGDIYYIGETPIGSSVAGTGYGVLDVISNGLDSGVYARIQDFEQGTNGIYWSATGLAPFVNTGLRGGVHTTQFVDGSAFLISGYWSYERTVSELRDGVLIRNIDGIPNPELIAASDDGTPFWQPAVQYVEQI